MRGSIKNRGGNSWRITYDIGMPVNGKRPRHSETFHGSEKDAQIRLRKLLTDYEKGIQPSSGRITVAEHLHNWLDGYVKTNCSVRTLDFYSSIVERHLIPALGQIQLKVLQPAAIQKYYGQACEKLSRRSVHHFHRVLSQSLKFAVRQGYLGRNPCDMVDAPSPKGKTMRTLTPAEVEVLLEKAGDNYYYPVIYTALNSGMRQAELLGLRWRDVDLNMLSISVAQVLYKRRGICEFKEPKTSHSRRRVAMTPKLGLYMREHLKAQQDLFNTMGRPHTEDALVFSTEGKPIDPTVLSHAFTRLARKVGLEGVRFHDLRHTFASLMLLLGAKPKVISEALGHASVAFTMDCYSHIISGMQEEAMALLDGVMPSGVVFKITSPNPSPN